MRILKTTLASGCLVLSLAACTHSSSTPTVSDGGKSSSASSSSTPASSSSSSSSSSSESGSSTSSETSSSAASSDSSGAAAATPSGTKKVTDPKASISFAVPSQWQTLDASVIKRPEVRKLMEPLAQRSGTSVDAIITQYTERTDMAVFDLSGASSFAENLNVTKAPASGLPAKGDLDSMIARTGATANAFEDMTTPLGKAAAQYYTLPVGDSQVHGCMLVVPTPSGTSAIVTVSASSEARARAIVKDIAASLQKAA